MPNEITLENIEFPIPKRNIYHSERDSLVSNKTILHFTRKFENLVSIIENGFCPRENSEYPNYLKDYIELREFSDILNLENTDVQNSQILMTCFSDIPKRAYKSHMKKYGYYGISIMKDWAISNFICPVIYDYLKKQIISLLMRFRNLSPEIF